MERVTSREFFREPYKHLGKVPLIITRRGVDTYKVEEIGDSPYLGKAVSPDLGFATGVTPAMRGEYGCGCKKTDEKLCKKHNRT